TTAIDAALASLHVPATIRGNFAGTAQLFQQSLANQPVLIGAALLAVYIVLGVLYESYIHPLTILSTLPSAGVGAVLALMLFNIEFSIIALIGVILLIGIVKKNAIMMIDFAIYAERSEGLTSRQAIYKASILRFRPIMMTTMAAALGAVPLAVGLGLQRMRCLDDGSRPSPGSHSCRLPALARSGRIMSARWRRCRSPTRRQLSKRAGMWRDRPTSTTAAPGGRSTVTPCSTA